MAEKIITEELLLAYPEWTEQGLKVGDPVPEKVAKPKADTVVVDRKMLEDILKEVQGLRDSNKDVEKLKKDNEMLLAVADKGRLQNYQAKNNPTGLIRQARAWVYEDKLVKATVTVKNQAFTDSLGRIHTDQVLNVIFEDGTEKEVTFDQFNKEKITVEGDIISRNTNDVNGQTFYTLKFKDGKEFVVNQLFTN